MEKRFLLLVITGILSLSSFAQVAVNTDGTQADQSAVLDVKSTTKGLLPPRMSNAQMNAISSPQAGLLVYNTTLNFDPDLIWYQ